MFVTVCLDHFHTSVHYRVLQQERCRFEIDDHYWTIEGVPVDQV